MTDCPQCHYELTPGQLKCGLCGFDFSRIKWTLLTEVTHPNELILESLLKSYAIPVRVVHQKSPHTVIPFLSVSLFPSSIIPVSIMVPEPLLRQAKDIIEPLEDEIKD